MRRDLRWHPLAVAAAIRGRLRALFARDAMERELDEEMRFHLDMEIAKHTRAGMAPDEARRTALVAFGGVDRATEAHRDARGTRFVEDAMADVRYAARALARTPGFVLTSLLTLAVAIAIATTAFTAMNAFLFAPLPVPHGDRVLSVFTSDFNGREFRGASSYADIIDFERGAATVADVAGETRVMLAIGSAENSVFAQGALVTPRYFQAAGIRPAIGLFPAPDAPAIVLGNTLWRRAFASDSSIVGRRIQVNGQSLVVAAIAPPEFRGVNRETAVEFWVDASLSPPLLSRDDLLQHRGQRGFRAIARLHDGQTLEALSARLNTVATQLFRSYPDAWRDTTGGSRAVTVMREQDAAVREMPRGALVLLVAGVIAFGFGLLAIACTNLASMQMARGAARRREIATRLALGADRARVIRQLLAECSLIAVPGVGLGVGLALAACRFVSAYRPIPLPSLDLSLDWHALAFVVVSLSLALLIFGLLPALQTARADVLTDLKGGDQPSAGGLRIGGVRSGLIVAQVAFSMLFTASAGLIAFALVRNANQGRAEAKKVLVSRVNFLPAAGDSAQAEALASELLDALRSIPGVEDVSASAFIPVRGSRWSVEAEARGRDGEAKRRELDVVYARPSYFRVVGIQMLRGRDFASGEAGHGTRPAIVSKAMADALWPDEDALGKSLKVDDRGGPAEIVGVVADPPGFVPATDHSYPGLLYLPQSVGRAAEVIFHVRAPIGQPAIAAQMAAVFHRHATQLVAPKAATIDEYLDHYLLPQRIIARASGAIAAVQLLLAVAGLSGLVAYVTALRRREIGIRTALGATSASVLRLVMRQGVRLTAVGAAIGLALSALVARVIADTLPMSPGVIAGGMVTAAGIFTAVGAIAMTVPARRALSVTPAEALRVD